MCSSLSTEIAGLVAALARHKALAATPPAERRVALLLRDKGAVDAALAALSTLKQAGYRIETFPDSSQDLARRLGAGEESLMCNDYAAYFAGLPRAEQQDVTARWSAPERDPAFRPGQVDCGRLVLTAARFGNVVLAIDDTGSAPPPHHALALRAYLEDGFRAQAVLTLDAPS